MFAGLRTPPLAPCRLLAPLAPCRLLAPLAPCRLLAPLAPCRLLAPLAEAGARWPLPSSLAVARSSRTAARQPPQQGGARFLDARSPPLGPARAIARSDPPTSSSLAEERTPPLAPCRLLAPLAEAGARWPLPSSLAVARSSRTAARQPPQQGGTRFLDARSPGPRADSGLARGQGHPAG